MKSNIKKGVLTLGTIAAVAAPIAAVISCGSTQNTINWKDSDTFGGVPGNDFLTEIKHLGKAKQNAITIGREQMMQLQYESESIRSFSAQVEDFRYANWQTEMDNKKLDADKADVNTDKDNYLKTVTTDGSVDESKIKPEKADESKTILDGYKTKIDTIEKSTKDNEDKIKDVKEKITKLEGILSKLDLTQEFLQDKDDVVANFYKNDYSASDYSEIYKPLSVIRSEKTDIVNDAYRTFYPQFTTREDGDREWPSELAKNYGGAANFAQAIDYLVTQEISAKAFNSYKFEINKSFTVQQKLWAQYIDKNNSFKFLISDGKDIAGSQSSSEIADDIKLIVGADSKLFKAYEDAEAKVEKDRISLSTASASTKATAQKTLTDSEGKRDSAKTAYIDSIDPATLEENILKVNKGETIGEAGSEKVVKSSVLSSTEIFLGSKSPDHRMPKDAYNELGKVVKYQHMLIKATQGKTPEESWTIKADDIKKLFQFDQYDDGGTTKITQGLDFIASPRLFSDTTGDDANKFTDFVLGAISGNSAGTIKTQGSLGIKSEIEYLKAMVPGFSLGALAITEGTQTHYKDIDTAKNSIKAPKDNQKVLVGEIGNSEEYIWDANKVKWTEVPESKFPTIDLSGLITNLKKKLKEEVTNIYGSYTESPTADALDTVDNQIETTLTTLGDDKVKTIFGKIFSDFFADKKDLVYKVQGTTDNYLVISQFGIHIIKRTAYDDGTKIKEALEQDMRDMAKDSSLSSSTTLVDELNSAFTDTKIMETLIQPETQADGTEKDSAYTEELIKKLASYNHDKTDDVDKVEIKDIRDVIKSVNLLKSKTDVDSAIGDKLENWLVTQIDAGLRDIKTLTLSEIYGWVQSTSTETKPGGNK